MWERRGTDEGKDEIEWWLMGKPWKERRFTSETVLVLIFTHLLSLSFRFVSSLMSGASSDTHFLAAFSRPSGILSSTRAVFGISFPYVEILRVTSAPITETPSILASVRDGWADRIKDERRLGAGCYEFRLKTSGWFSTPPTDSARAQTTLNLIHNLDRSGIYLITEVRLNGSIIWLFETEAGPLE